jgi:hypothetical protein
VITQIKGTMITVSHKGKLVTRNSSWFKLYHKNSDNMPEDIKVKVYSEENCSKQDNDKVKSNSAGHCVKPRIVYEPSVPILNRPETVVTNNPVNNAEPVVIEVEPETVEINNAGNIAEPVVMPNTVRRSTRNSSRPKYLNDFTC